MAVIHPSAIHPLVLEAQATAEAKMATYNPNRNNLDTILKEMSQSLSTASVGAPQGHDTLASTSSAPTRAITMGELEKRILEKSAKNCLQTSMIIDHDTLWSSFQSEDEMKNEVKLRLKTAMVDNLIEKIAYTRIDNKHEHNVTFNARCYVFTREELINLIKEFQ